MSWNILSIINKMPKSAKVKHQEVPKIKMSVENQNAINKLNNEISFGDDLCSIVNRQLPQLKPTCNLAFKEEAFNSILPCLKKIKKLLDAFYSPSNTRSFNEQCAVNRKRTIVEEKKNLTTHGNQNGLKYSSRRARKTIEKNRNKNWMIIRPICDVVSDKMIINQICFWAELITPHAGRTVNNFHNNSRYLFNNFTTFNVFAPHQIGIRWLIFLPVVATLHLLMTFHTIACASAADRQVAGPN